MSPAKQVSFAEKVYNSRLGIEGMQIVVYSDRARVEDETIIDEELNFTDICNQMMKEVNGDLIRKKYNIREGEEFGKKLHEERINWIKEKLKN